MMESKRNTGTALPFKVKISYSAGEMASQFMWTFTSSYLTIFYTDIAGLSAAAIGLIFMVARVWDAVNDPMMGLIAERTKSKYGRFRPYILYCTPFMALFVILTFTSPSFGGNSAMKTAWALITYMGLGMLYTAVNLPFGSLINVMTDQSEERNSLASFRTLGMGLGATGVSAVGLPILLYFSGGQNYSQKGYLVLTIAIAAVVVPLFLGVVFRNCREVVKPVNQGKVSVVQSLKTCMNRPLGCVFGFVLLGLTAKFGYLAVLSYYAIYVLRNPGLTAVLFTVLNVCTLISVFIGSWLVKRFGKKTTLFLSCMLCAAAHVAVYFTDWGNIQMIMFFVAVRGLAEFGQPCFMSTVPDCVDYAEAKTGIRADGTASAVQSFSAKLGSAIGGAAGVAMLAGVGYVANTTQTQAAMQGMNAVINLAPAVCWLLALIPVCMYPLNEKKMSLVKEKLVNEYQTA